MYIHCETCQEWYHADALQLDESKLSYHIGFKCCRCRKLKSPVCPYASSNLKKAEGNSIQWNYSSEIEMYYEMTIIGQDVAKGNCAKSFGDIELHSHENVRNLTKKSHCLSDTVKNNEKYLEDKIEMYDETMVAGEGAAGGNCANSFDNIEPQSHENSIHLVEKGDCVGETSKDEDKQSTSSVGLPLESMKVRKRAHEGDSEIQMISTLLKEIAMALQRLSKSQLDVGQLYEEVMKTKGFEEELLVCAFDHLVEKENQARGFLAKSDKLRKIWLQKFEENNH